MLNETFNMQMKRVNNDLGLIMRIMTETSVIVVTEDDKIVILSSKYEDSLSIMQEDQSPYALIVPVKEITGIIIRKETRQGILDEFDTSPDLGLPDLLGPTHSQILSLQ